MLELERARMTLEDNVAQQDMYDEVEAWMERADELTATVAQLRRDLVQADEGRALDRAALEQRNARLTDVLDATNDTMTNIMRENRQLEAANAALGVELQGLRAALASAQEYAAHLRGENRALANATAPSHVAQVPAIETTPPTEEEMLTGIQDGIDLILSLSQDALSDDEVEGRRHEAKRARTDAGQSSSSSSER